jgi:integrase
MTCVTPRRRWPIASGANPKVVQRMLGHASAAMTLDVYAEMWARGDDAAIQQTRK